MKIEETIKEAYGIHWEQLKGFVTVYGWIKLDKYTSKFKELFELANNVEFRTYGSFTQWRPKTLKNLSRSNGWKKIENFNNFKTKKNSICLILTNKNNILTYDRYCSLFSINETEFITHYQFIDFPKPPNI